MSGALHGGRTHGGRRIMKWKDEIVEEMRQAAAGYAVRFDYDVKRKLEDLKDRKRKIRPGRANLKPLKPHQQRV
jgi:hypothetical protein